MLEHCFPEESQGCHFVPHYVFFWSPDPEDGLSANGLLAEGGLMPETGLPVPRLCFSATLETG